jgi:hypothetical protein
MAATTLSEALTEVSTRLGDENNTFWSLNELYLYLCESLRVLNSITGFWRTTYIVTLTAPFTQNWFSTAGAGSPRIQTLTDTDLYNLIEYHLLEPATGATWTGTNQFAITDLWQPMSRRRNEILQMAACNMGEDALAIVPVTATIPLPDNILDVRRTRWLPGPGLGSPATLQRGDALSYQRFSYNYGQTNQPPLRWTLLNGLEAALSASGELLALQLDTLAPTPSQTQILAIEGGPDFNPPGGNPLLMPDDWAWVLKFGTMADIFSKEEEGRDVPRGTYCRQRYEQGIKAMERLPWMTQALVDGLPVDIISVAAADRFNYEWQTNAGAFPGLVIGGVDLYSVAPYPTTTISLSLTVVQNAPIPVNTPTAPIYLPRDAMEAVLLEATHLALLKMGGQEFTESMALHQGFIDYCMKTNSRLLEEGIFPTDYASVVPLQDTQDPRFTLQGGS